MKIIISGKGGSGKSTISALLAIALKDLGFCVLLVDADESNEGLHRHLGISYPVPLLDYLGGKQALLLAAFDSGPKSECQTSPVARLDGL